MLMPLAFLPRVLPHLPADGALASPHDPGDLGAYLSGLAQYVNLATLTGEANCSMIPRIKLSGV